MQNRVWASKAAKGKKKNSMILPYWNILGWGGVGKEFNEIFVIQNGKCINDKTAVLEMDSALLNWLKQMAQANKPPSPTD